MLIIAFVESIDLLMLKPVQDNRSALSVITIVNVSYTPSNMHITAWSLPRIRMYDNYLYRATFCGRRPVKIRHEI